MVGGIGSLLEEEDIVVIVSGAMEVMVVVVVLVVVEENILVEEEDRQAVVLMAINEAGEGLVVKVGSIDLTLLRDTGKDAILFDNCDINQQLGA